jgi:hypothetical protein
MEAYNGHFCSNPATGGNFITIFDLKLRHWAKGTFHSNVGHNATFHVVQKICEGS